MNNNDIDNNTEEIISHIRIKYFLFSFILICLVAVISSAVTFYYIETGVEARLAKAKTVEINQDATPEESTKIIAETLKSFRDVVDKNFKGEIDEQKLLEGSIKGYINGLGDEYSEYFTKEEWEEFQADALGNYVGVGIYMGMDKSNNIVIVAPIKGTPAEEAGIQSGDIITEIDGESTDGMKSDEAARRVKGKEGTKVKLKLLRDDSFVDVELERKQIKVYHVENKMLDDNIGYISLLTFDDGCAEEIKKAYEELKSNGAKKIILDLRNNTGGLVNEALQIADYIIEKDKTVLITEDNKGNKKYSKAKTNPIIDCPIVVLVNEYSASASEILTGALKDNKYAKIVGTKTYGKGVIQNVIQLEDGSALKLTIAEYFTPNETKINKVGIEPDEIVEDEEQKDGEEEVDEQLNKAIEVIKNM